MSKPVELQVKVPTSEYDIEFNTASYRDATPEEAIRWLKARGALVEAGAIGAWQCNTCGNDCRADGPGCEGSEYDSEILYSVKVSDG